MITKSQLKLRVKENLKFAKDFYEKGDGEDGLAVMMVVDTVKDGKKSGVAAILANEGAVEKRRDIAFDLGVRAGIDLSKGIIDSIDAFFMISEAWYSTAEKDTAMDKMPMPSQDPNKKEAIVSTGMSKEGATAIGMFELKKSFDLDNAKIKVSFEPIGDGPKVVGDGEIESPLLQQFWNGVKLMEKFDETLPPILRDHLKGLTTDKIFDMFSRSINELREKHK